MNVGNNLSIESRQDSNQYDSKQTQASAGVSIAIYGSGSNASINANRNKAKLNYAQVEEQSGLSAGEGGLAINVGNHTHLKGGLIESKAEESKNRLHTKTFSTEDIKNHSEVKVESHSVGLSTNMAQNAMSAVATTIGALGNKNESKQSLTQSAVGNNIHFTAESQDEKTQQNLTALSRDTANANQKVQAYDLAEIRENQELANVAGQVGARLVGDVSQMLEWEEGSPQKIALHAVVGALAAKWSGGNVAVGAGAGALSEWANSQIEDYLKNHPELNLSQDERYAIQQATAAALGAAVGAVIGGNSESVGQGALTAYNAEKFNRQLHSDELERIKALAKGDKDKQARLEAAACALVHCSAQIPEDSEDYAKAYQQAKALEELGSRPEFAEERALLKTQLADVDPLDSLSGYRRPLFQYNGIQAVHDKVGKYDTKYGVTTRLGGALQTAGGAAVIGGSSAIAGAGCVSSAGTGCALSITAGSVVATYGADQAYAGLNKIVTGKNQNTFGASLLASTTGLSQETAELIYGLPASFSGGKVLSSGMNTAGKWAVNEGKQTAGAVAYTAKEIGKDIKAGANALNNVAQRGYIQGTQLLEQGAKKAISSVQNYPNYVSKSMADTTVKVAVSNGIAAAGVKAGFEGYDYYSGKSLTRENLLNSGKEVALSGGLGLATSGMPFSVALATGLAVDKINEGKIDLRNNISSSVLGEMTDKYLPYNPVIREIISQSFNEIYKKSLKEKSDE